MYKDKSITFRKDDHGWFAVVEGKSRASNAMILGADKLCEAMAAGKDEVSVDFIYDDGVKAPKGDTSSNKQPKDFIVKLRRIEHDPFGATYWLSGPMKKKFGVPIIWLCNVTEFFLGCDHPKTMFITNISTQAM